VGIYDFATPSWHVHNIVACKNEKFKVADRLVVDRFVADTLSAENRWMLVDG
jgi:hypothetical protein